MNQKIVPNFSGKTFFMFRLNHAVQCTHQFPMFLKRQTEGDTRNISQIVTILL